MCSFSAKDKISFSFTIKISDLAESSEANLFILCKIKKLKGILMIYTNSLFNATLQFIILINFYHILINKFQILKINYLLYWIL